MDKILYIASESPYINETPIPTGLPSLDWAIGIGGIPAKRITEIFGHKSSGKTTLSLKIIQTAQQAGLKCVFVDAENALNFARAKELGVDLDKLDVIHAEYGEQYLDEVERLIREGKHKIIVIDSVDALVPKSIIEATNEQQSMGVHARMMGKFLRRVIVPIRKHGVALILLNQVRVNIMDGNEYTPGGKALEFYTSVRIKLNQVIALKQGDKFIGFKMKARITKNKIGAPLEEVESNLLFASGFSASADLVDTAIKAGVITKEKTTFFFQGEKLAIGMPKLRKLIEGDNSLAERIKLSLVV